MLKECSTQILRGMIGRILNESSIQQRRLQKPKGQILFICEAAALLHDVIDDKIVQNPADALKELKKFLTSIEVTPEQIEAIVSIITRMSFKNHKGAVKNSL